MSASDSNPPAANRPDSTSADPQNLASAVAKQQAVGLSPTRYRSSQTLIEEHFYSGPVPTPEDLARFGRVNPSFPDRLVAMAESEQRHRHKMDSEFSAIEQRDVEQGWAAVRRGQYCALAIAMVSLVGCFVLIANGQVWAGGIIGSLGVASIVAAFLRQPRLRADSGSPEPATPEGPGTPKPNTDRAVSNV